jgi:hypothetical protein
MKLPEARKESGGRQMKVKRNFTARNSRFATVLMAGVAAFLLYSVPARADLIVSIESPINVNAGTAGNGFDVLLTNSGPSAVSIAGFTFELSVPGTDILLSDATTATVVDPYIFSGHSLFGPNIEVTNTGQDLSASDLDDTFANITLGMGATVGLGHILFDVSAGAPTESVPVKLVAFPATSLADDQTANVQIDTLSNGQINITGTVGNVPESSSLLLLLTAGSLIWVGFRIRLLS